MVNLALPTVAVLLVVLAGCGAFSAPTETGEQSLRETDVPVETPTLD